MLCSIRWGFIENALSNPTEMTLHSVVYIQFYGLVVFKEMSLCFGICGLAALLVCALLFCGDFVGFMRKFGLSCSVILTLKKKNCCVWTTFLKAFQIPAGVQSQSLVWTRRWTCSFGFCPEPFPLESWDCSCCVSLEKDLIPTWIFKLFLGRCREMKPQWPLETLAV